MTTVGNITFGPRNGGTVYDHPRNVPRDILDAIQVREYGASTISPIQAFAPAIGTPAVSYNRSFNDNRTGDFMQTYSGRKFWPLDPRPDEIHIEDIAHSLAHQCRYAGHCERFYSVAEHCVHIARWLPTEKLWGLMHDAAEAYTVDVPRPLKRSLVGYAEAEAKVMAAVCERFGLPVEMPAVVHEADMRIIADEVAQNMRPMEWHARHDDPLGVVLQFWTPEEAEDHFLETFVELTMDEREPRWTAEDAADDAYQLGREQEAA